MSDEYYENYKSVERTLLSLCLTSSSPDENIRVCTVALDVQDVGGWIVKFRRHGVLVNNRDLVSADCVDVDASLSCSTSGFWTIVNGGIQIQDAINKNLIHCSGPIEFVEYFYHRLITSTEHANSHTVITTEMMKRLGAVPGPDPTSSPAPQADPFAAPHPLKTGWLLKKRDVFSSWRCRYFVLYPGKLAYYTDQHDSQPKAVIPLLDADIYAAKRCTIAGNTDHWYLIVELSSDSKEEKLRLASELSGEEGHLDTSLWVKELLLAKAAGADRSRAGSSSVPASPSQSVGHASPISKSGRRHSTSGVGGELLPTRLRANSSADMTAALNFVTGIHPTASSGSGAGLGGSQGGERDSDGPGSVTVIPPLQFQRVERALLSLCFADTGVASTASEGQGSGGPAASPPAPAECTVALDVQDVGGWIVKFRRHGVLVNNRDLVSADCVDVDASLSCSTSASWGSEGSGEQSRACSDSMAVFMVSAGDHWSFRMSRQMAPVCEEMLGCHTLRGGAGEIEQKEQS